METLPPDHGAPFGALEKVWLNQSHQRSQGWEWQPLILQHAASSVSPWISHVDNAVGQGLELEDLSRDIPPALREKLEEHLQRSCADLCMADLL